MVGGLRPVSGERRKGVGMVLRIEFLSGIESKLLSILSIYMGLFHRSIIVLFLWDISSGIVAFFISSVCEGIGGLYEFLRMGGDLLSY